MDNGLTVSGKLNDLLEQSPVVFYISELRGNTHAARWVSPNIQSILGYSPDEALQPDWWKDNLHPLDRERIEAGLINISSPDKELLLEYRFLHKNNGYLWIRDTVRSDTASSEHVIISGIWQNITSYRQSLDKLANLQRAYGMLTKTNQLLMQGKKLTQLYKDICEVAVNEGGFKLAWLGLLDADTNEIRPVARAGVDLGYIDDIHATLDNGDPRSLGPTATALRDNRVSVVKSVIIGSAWSRTSALTNPLKHGVNPHLNAVFVQ